MANFDASARESRVVRPALTNTPLQALDLMNNVTYVEAARVLAQRMMKEGGATPAGTDRIRRSSASPCGSPRKRRTLSWSIPSATASTCSQTKPSAAQKFVSNTGEAPARSDLDVSELAAYTNVASLILNLNRSGDEGVMIWILDSNRGLI